MKPKNHIILEYIEALTNRSEKAGDDRLSFAVSCLYETLQELNLSQNYLDKLEEMTLKLTK